MGKEIERKFLVKSDDYRQLAEGILYRQGYLSSVHQRIVRVRTIGNKGYITIKGSIQGISRTEFEYERPLADANEMLNDLCEKPVIEKYRYKLQYSGFLWEIDEFLGENEGLVVAEIELPDEDTNFQKPEWVGQEVTTDMRYHNSNLAKHPFRQWQQDGILSFHHFKA